MKGRRIAAGLCVALAHVLVIAALLGSRVIVESGASFESTAITPILPDTEPPLPELPLSAARVHIPAPSPLPEDTPADAPSAIAATPATPPERIDWPIEAHKSAKRVLEAEAEAERIAKMFSGPGGTWASLTKRQRSQLKAFRWKPGANGLEYDEKGNAIYHVSEGCVIVNMSFFACSLGKQKVYGDLFKEMKQYFDEQRLPETKDGNGTEPEALRPAR